MWSHHKNKQSGERNTQCTRFSSTVARLPRRAALWLLKNGSGPTVDAPLGCAEEQVRGQSGKQRKRRVTTQTTQLYIRVEHCVFSRHFPFLSTLPPLSPIYSVNQSLSDEGKTKPKIEKIRYNFRKDRSHDGIFDEFNAKAPERSIKDLWKYFEREKRGLNKPFYELNDNPCAERDELIRQITERE